MCITFQSKINENPVLNIEIVEMKKLVLLSILACSAVLIGGTAILASCSNYAIK